MENLTISNLPTSVLLDLQTGIFDPAQKVDSRRLSDLAAVYHDQNAVQEILRSEDRLVYEIRYHAFITSNSDMALGVTRIYPGKIGDEYHMTKGHFHLREDQPEIYFCVQGEGYLLMETREGEFQAVAWKPGVITHIPPAWAHRVVNTGDQVLYFVASYHVSAGHVYEPIVERGFSKVVVEREGRPILAPNPRRLR